MTGSFACSTSAWTLSNAVRKSPSAASYSCLLSARPNSADFNMLTLRASPRALRKRETRADFEPDSAELAFQRVILKLGGEIRSLLQRGQRLGRLWRSR